MGVRKGFGQRVKQLRKAAKLTQEQLAKRASMDWKYLGSVERGERNITIDNIERIIKGLGVEPFEVFFFSVTDQKAGDTLDENALAKLLKHSDAPSRQLLTSVIQSILRWSGKGKK